jgi:hypothetical protein
MTNHTGDNKTSQIVALFNEDIEYKVLCDHGNKIILRSYMKFHNKSTYNLLTQDNPPQNDHVYSKSCE